MISDDGMKVIIDNIPILENDSVHPPIRNCASTIVTFNGTDPKLITVLYFQGPRTSVAMQLLVRPQSKNDGNCRSDGSWQEISASAFSH